MGEGRRWWKSGMVGVVGIALATVVVHLAVGWRYGFDRDELLALEDARHLAWGYVQYPPMTAFFGWVALKLFGTSLGGFRFFAALVQAVALVLTGLMAKEIARGAEIGKWKFEEAVPSGAEAPSETRLKVAAEAATHKASGRDVVLGGTAGQNVKGNEGRVKTFPVERTRARFADAQGKQEDIKSEAADEGGGKKLVRPAGEWAASVAALAGVPFCLGAGALMQYISFDYVCWVMVAWGMVKLVTAENRNSKIEMRNSEEDTGSDAGGEEQRFLAAQTSSGITSLREGEGGRGAVKPPLQAERWWVVVGAGIGLGMLAKYTMGLLVAGVAVGVLVTPLRRHLRSPWLWAGVALSVAIFLPNCLWEWRHGFVSVDFLRFLHERDVREGVTNGFLVGQLEVTMLAVPLAVAGLWFYFAREEGRPYRALGWMYVVPLVLLVVLQGREYYLAPAYPMLYAAGAVLVERRSKEARKQGSNEEKRRLKIKDRQDASVESLGPPASAGRPAARPQDGNALWGRWMRRVVGVVLVVDVVVAGAVALPIAPVNSRWWKMASKVDLVFPEEIGWEEFTQSVAETWRRLAESERARAAILAGNYGELGALNLYGERWGLPQAISGVNSSWERGFGAQVPETLVVVGYPRELLEKYFASCEVGGRVWNKYGVANEETMEDPEIFVCRGRKGSWEEFWKAVRKYA